MIIYLGADHRGFNLKNKLRGFLKDLGYEAVDLGNTELDENDDYPDFAAAVAEKVMRDYENSRGVLICGSGVGVCVVANRFPKIRAALIMSPNQAFDSRDHDDANVICLGSDYVSEEEAKKIIATWLSTPFSGEERHRRRIEKINQIDQRLKETERET